MSSSTAASEARTDGMRAAVALLALIGYQGCAHWVAVAAASGRIATLAPFALPAVIALWGGWRRGVAAAGAVLASLAVVLAMAATWPPASRALPLLSQLAICLGLAWVFGRTLLPGREPLITRVASQVHGTLTPPIARYTRNVTLAWCAFLTAMAGTSGLLFALVSIEAWSLFANVLFLPLVLLMFLAEYAYRVLRYPWFRQVTLLQSIQAFHRHRAAAAPTARSQ
jgi:uncharacterized membrane protein